MKLEAIEYLNDQTVACDAHKEPVFTLIVSTMTLPEGTSGLHHFLPHCCHLGGLTPPPRKARHRLTGALWGTGGEDTVYHL